MARAVLVVIVVVAGVGAYLLLHGDEPDIALTGGSMTRALDGTRGDGERFSGRGRVAVVHSVSNERDEPLRLSGSRAQRRELGRLGIGIRVGYVPIPRQAVLPNRIVPRNLRARLPPGTSGALVHLFDLRDCKRGSRAEVSHFDLEVAEDGDDPHTALVDVTVRSDKHALWSYAKAADGIRLRLRCT